MSDLTEDDIKRYLETDGSNCPFCAHDKFHLGSVRGGTGTCFRDITCLACDKTWREWFHLAEFQYPPDASVAKIERP